MCVFMGLVIFFGGKLWGCYAICAWKHEIEQHTCTKWDFFKNVQERAHDFLGRPIIMLNKTIAKICAQHMKIIQLSQCHIGLSMLLKHVPSNVSTMQKKLVCLWLFTF